MTRVADSIDKAEQPDEGPHRPGQGDWSRALRYCATVYLAVRAALLLVGLLATGLLPLGQRLDVPGWPATDPGSPWHHAFTAWERFDALWYLRIASAGYRPDDGSAAFFPVYPLLVRGVGTVLGDRWLLAAFLVSNLALLAALVVLYRLTALELSEGTARRTVLLVCLFPTGFFLFSPFTESLFLALTVGALYAARRRSWLLAGYLAALASGTRSAGALLLLPLAVEAVLQLRSDAGPLRPRLLRLGGALAASAASVLGVAAYLLWWERFSGDWRRPLDVQRSTWAREQSWPWETLADGVRLGVQYLGSYPGGYHGVDALVVLVALVAGVWVTRRVRPTYAVWFWVSLLFPLLLVWDGRPLMSMPRFCLVVFPLFWALARLGERWRLSDAVVAVSTAGLGMLSLLFIAWQPIF